MHVVSATLLFIEAREHVTGDRCFYFDRLYIVLEFPGNVTVRAGLCGMETRCLCLLLVCVLSLNHATADNGSVKKMKMQYTGMPLLKFQIW